MTRTAGRRPPGIQERSPPPLTVVPATVRRPEPGHPGARRVFAAVVAALGAWAIDAAGADYWLTDAQGTARVDARYLRVVMIVALLGWDWIALLGNGIGCWGTTADRRQMRAAVFALSMVPVFLVELTVPPGWARSHPHRGRRGVDPGLPQRGPPLTASACGVGSALGTGADLARADRGMPVSVRTRCGTARYARPPDHRGPAAGRRRRRSGAGLSAAGRPRSRGRRRRPCRACVSHTTRLPSD
ncbi:hypothetical protein HBB16_15195 [Pseudonocardia sp. MCCB 268]|nr:hypothetical protein [Pseudonocardia cytotoxica]